MNPTIAIIGSGPTGIYTLKGLVSAATPLSITIFEVEADPGKGTPYHPHINDHAMLANIASVEIPEICESLIAWLRRQSDVDLQKLNVIRTNIDDREFYPRVVLGEFLQSQFLQLVALGISNGHSIQIKPNHRVSDLRLRTDDIQITVSARGDESKRYGFDHVVMATGHNWPEHTEIKPAYFVSPWPALALKSIKACPVGILGTSLSAIDALVTASTAHGTFYLDPAGQLQYRASPESDRFHVTLMSRKGILPEADFYCQFPYAPLQICTREAVEHRIKGGTANLLDDVFELFKGELLANDPSYAAKIGLSQLKIETLASAYFADRENSDPFVWAASNLAEAKQNKANRYVVQWRYAILRMHEVIARAVPHLDETDLARFHKHFKTVFIDDYATIPHQSIERILALRRAGKLDIQKLGNRYRIVTDNVKEGAQVHYEGQHKSFGAFIDATGQASMSAQDIPFPSLIEQEVIKAASTPESADLFSTEADESFTRTGGIDLDDAFRPKFTANLCNRLYCAAISFLLHKLPFVQGITSAAEIGSVVSKAVLDDVEGNRSAGQSSLIITP